MEILEIKKNLGTNHDDDELIVTWLYVDGKMRCIPRYVDGKKYFGNPNEKCDNQSFAGCRLYIDGNGNNGYYAHGFDFTDSEGKIIKKGEL